jgi:hypothetical protein
MDRVDREPLGCVTATSTSSGSASPSTVARVSPCPRALAVARTAIDGSSLVPVPSRPSSTVLICPPIAAWDAA